MGFFGSVKNKLGIGGVKIALQVSGHVSKDDTNIDGVVVLTTKSEQEVLTVTVKFIEEFTTGRGDNETEKEFELGSVTIPANFTINPGDVKEIPFSLPFSFVASNADKLKEKGGALGALGKMAKFANNEKSEYYVNAYADIKGVIKDSFDEKEIKLI